MSVVKYTPAGGTSATNVHFTYAKLDLVKLMMETCQNMVKIATGQNGEALVNEYAMDDDTPTMRMKQKMLDSPMADIVSAIHRLTDNNFTEQLKNAIGTDANVVIPIRYVTTFNDAHLDAMDKDLQDMIIYGALIQWFTAVKADNMKASCQEEYQRARLSLLSGIKELYRKITFHDIDNYTMS